MVMEDRVRSKGTAEQPIGGWAESEGRDLADAARRRAQDVKTYATEAREYAQGAVEQTREYVEGAVQQARDKVTDKVAEYREGGFEKVKHDLAGYTREQPMTALLIATGAGLVLGWLSAIGRR
jgi:ElaB/YqjD/DUF883 family membrane-anchored ribosome-binding protein